MSTSLYVIGKNQNEFGTKLKSKIHSLTKIDSIPQAFTKIKQIICGEMFNIYCESIDKYDNIWSAGNNSLGQCATNDFKKIVNNDGFHRIEYFNDNNITITKIWVNTNSSNIFWLTANGKNNVYANGKNNDFQLGLDNGNYGNQCTPKLVHGLQNVIDIQTTSDYSIALCSNKSPNMLMIIQFWSRTLEIKIPNDILSIINEFHNLNQVLSVGWSYPGAQRRKIKE